MDIQKPVRIGIVSDTHGLLRPQVEETLKQCDYIFHAGDFDTGKLYQQMRRIGPPLSAVRGNNDLGRWAEKLPEICRVEAGGIRFLIVHDRQDVLEEYLSQVDVVIFGHSHRLYCQEEDGILWLNPGSCGKRRFSLPLAMCVMEIADGKYQNRFLAVCG